MLPQPAPRVVEVRPHGARRKPEVSGDLLVLPAFEVVQQDHLALSLGEALPVRREAFPKLAALQLQGRRRSSGHLVQLQRLGGPDRVMADQIPGPVADDLQQPAAEPRRVPAVVDPLDRRDKPVLASIIGVRLVAGDREGDGPAGPEVSLQEPIRRAGVAGPDACHKCRIGFLHRPLPDTRGGESVEGAAEPASATFGNEIPHPDRSRSGGSISGERASGLEPATSTFPRSLPPLRWR